MEKQATPTANNPADIAADIITALSTLAADVRQGDPKAVRLLMDRLFPALKSAGLWS